MMIRCLFKTFAILSVCGLSAAAASAQTPAVLRKLNTKYERIWPFDRGLAMVRNDSRYGFVDTLGRVAIPLIYIGARPFKNGYAVVTKGTGDEVRSGLIDRTGREVLPFVWNDLGAVGREGVAVGWRKTPEGGRSYAIVDTLGHEIPLKYDLCRDFAHGMAVVGIGDYQEEVIPISGKKMQVFVGKCGYITPDGKEAIPVQFDEARNFGADGIASVGIQGKYYIKWGFIDRSGKQIIPCNYYSVENFSRGLAVVCKVVGPNKLGYGYIDRSGREVVPCKYDAATSFRFENTWVGTEHNGEMSYTLIDATGKVLLPYSVLRLQDGGKYGQAACAVRGDDGRLRYGILANSGRSLLPFEYDEITIFSDRDPQTGKMQEAAMATKDGQSFSFDISIRE